MFKQLSVLAIAMTLSVSAIAQSFVPVTMSYSRKKSFYIFMADGEKVVCTIKSLGWKKGLIDDLKILNLDGDKVKISPEEIRNCIRRSR
ncbi:MAG: hypothetical protein P8H56_08610 [Crocinitomicaceae bacterium]|nr:hypothetical protein [Crocinitomicaceae bacterium]